VPKPAEGEPCLDSYSCAPGLYCEPKKAGDATTKCAPLPGPGEKCSPTHTCSVAAYCDPTGDSCVAKLANGSPCENTDWCTSGYCSPHGHLCEEACLATPAGGCAGGYRDLYAFYLFFAGLVVVGRRRGKR
jgi:hypothetical protein